MCPLAWGEVKYMANQLYYENPAFRHAALGAASSVFEYRGAWESEAAGPRVERGVTRSLIVSVPARG